MEKRPFIEVENKPLVNADGRIYGKDYLNNLMSLRIGGGSTMFAADSSGIWLGALKFSDAPFKVDMQGNIYLQSANGKIIIDGVNNRIVVNDGLTNRIVIGTI